MRLSNMAASLGSDLPSPFCINIHLTINKHGIQWRDAVIKTSQLITYYFKAIDKYERIMASEN